MMSVFKSVFPVNIKCSQSGNLNSRQAHAFKELKTTKIQLNIISDNFFCQLLPLQSLKQLLHAFSSLQHPLLQKTSHVHTC